MLRRAHLPRFVMSACLRIVYFPTQGVTSKVMTANNVESNSTAPDPSGHSDPVLQFPGPRAKALVNLAQKLWLNPLTDTPVPPEEWATAPLPKALCQQKVGLILPADARAISLAIDATPDSILIDLNAESRANEKRIFQALKTAVDFCSAVPQMWLLPRNADGGINSSLHDVAIYVAEVVERARTQDASECIPVIGIELNTVKTPEDAARWATVLTELERALELPPQQIRVILRIDTHQAIKDPNVIMFPLRERLVAIRLTVAAVMSDIVRQGTFAEGAFLPARQDALTLEFPLADAMSKHFTVVAHRHGVLALSGLLPALPVHDDPDAQALILKETSDLARERVRNGYDGLALAHTALMPALDDVFVTMMPTANQLERPLDWSISATDLELSSAGPISDSGFHNTVGVAILGIEAGLKGQTRIALYNQIEDTLSIALCWQLLWHWLHTPSASLDDGRPIDESLFRRVLDEELEIIDLERNSQLDGESCAKQAAALLQQLCLGDDIKVSPEFPLS